MSELNISYIREGRYNCVKVKYNRQGQESKLSISQLYSYNCLHNLHRFDDVRSAVGRWPALSCSSYYQMLCVKAHMALQCITKSYNALQCTHHPKTKSLYYSTSTLSCPVMYPAPGPSYQMLRGDFFTGEYLTLWLFPSGWTLQRKSYHLVCNKRVLLQFSSKQCGFYGLLSIATER